jgi:hypothetical protein
MLAKAGNNARRLALFPEYSVWNIFNVNILLWRTKGCPKMAHETTQKNFL